ncbi:MAG: DUF1570 domain-containing protein, partial [Opitutaceae bacterium]|nr:DUF1570 domain-containing protein [Opitutaceae bacterium]
MFGCDASVGRCNQPFMDLGSLMTRRISIGFSWLLSWALLVTLAGGKETWIKADTENFEIYSSASEAKSRALLEDLEQFRATLLKVMKLPPGHEPRTTIVLFDRASDFERYQPLYQGKPKEVSGYFSRGEDLAMMALSPNTRDEDRVRRVIFHEYLHQLLATHGLARIPVWLNEGLAEFFSTFQYEKGRAIIGRPLEAQLIFLNQVAWLPLQAVLAAKMDSPEYNEDFRNSVFYAQAWALVHYLLCAKDTDYAPLLNRYLAQAAQPGQVAMPDFVDFTQIDVDDLAKRLRRYTKTGRYSPYKIDESA